MTVSMVFTDIKRENMNYLANMVNPQNNYQQPNWQGFGQGQNIFGGGNFMQNHPRIAQNNPDLAQYWNQPQGQQAQGQGSPSFGQMPANMPRQFQPPQGQGFQGRGNMNWTGGDPNFDERTGQPRQFNSIYG